MGLTTVMAVVGSLMSAIALCVDVDVLQTRLFPHQAIDSENGVRNYAEYTFSTLRFCCKSFERHVSSAPEVVLEA